MKGLQAWSLRAYRSVALLGAIALATAGGPGCGAEAPAPGNGAGVEASDDGFDAGSAGAEDVTGGDADLDGAGGDSDGEPRPGSDVSADDSLPGADLQVAEDGATSDAPDTPPPSPTMACLRTGHRRSPPPPVPSPWSPRPTTQKSPFTARR